MNYPKEIFKDIYRSLPEELKNIVATPEISNINDEIAQKHKLNDEQRLSLGDEITMRLMGITTRNAFPENLKNRLQIKDEEILTILEDINSKILSKISEKVSIAQEEYSQTKIKNNLSDMTNTPNQEEPTETTSIEIPPANLPMIEPGEVSHDTKPQMTPPVVETKPTISQPAQKPSAPVPPKPVNIHYPTGQDPYREPLQ